MTPKALLILALLVAVGGCSGSDETPGYDLDSDSQAQVVADAYAARVFAAYQETETKAKDLEAKIKAFVAAPSEAGFTACKSAWLAARPAYGRTEAFRFYGGPIDAKDTGKEGEINGWPLDENFVDYVKDDPDAGIVNKPTEFPTIDAKVIAGLNEKDGEKNLSTGWHAIEFLLWGQDLDDAGPGKRPYTDFVDSGTAKNQARRRTYLVVAAELLVADLAEVRAAWEPTKGYAATWVTRSRKQSLLDVFQGIVSLSGIELGGERMTVAYTNQDQEDEHSCFSDNTTADFAANQEGIAAIYLGSAERPGLSVLVKAKDAAIDAAARKALDDATAAIKAIPAPFDTAIKGEPGRQKVKAAIDALKVQTDALVKAANLLDLKVSTKA